MTRANLTVVRDVLSRARARLAEPSRWCRGALADGAGNPLISERHPAAAAWSVLGALYVALYERRGDLTLAAHETPASGVEAVAAVRAVARALTDSGVDRDHGAACRAIADWADREDRKHAEVVELLTRALAEVSPRPRAVQTGT